MTIELLREDLLKLIKECHNITKTLYKFMEKIIEDSLNHRDLFSNVIYIIRLTNDYPWVFLQDSITEISKDQQNWQDSSNDILNQVWNCQRKVNEKLKEINDLHKKPGDSQVYNNAFKGAQVGGSLASSFATGATMGLAGAVAVGFMGGAVGAALLYSGINSLVNTYKKEQRDQIINRLQTLIEIMNELEYIVIKLQNNNWYEKISEYEGAAENGHEYSIEITEELKFLCKDFAEEARAKSVILLLHQNALSDLMKENDL